MSLLGIHGNVPKSKNVTEWRYRSENGIAWIKYFTLNIKTDFRIFTYFFLHTILKTVYSTDKYCSNNIETWAPIGKILGGKIKKFPKLYVLRVCAPSCPPPQWPSIHRKHQMMKTYFRFWVGILKNVPICFKMMCVFSSSKTSITSSVMLRS